MKNKSMILAVAVLFTAGIIISAGCSGDPQAQKKNSVVDEMVDSLASAIVDNLPEVTLASATADEETFEPSVSKEKVPAVADFVVVDSTIYVVYGGKLVKYNLSTNQQFTFPADEKFNAVVSHLGDIYVGGDGLYQVDDTTLKPVDFELVGAITDLYSYEYRLMIGTRCGLQALSIFGHEQLFDDISVTSMTADNNGLWIGTAGQGLYRWDGNEFHQRYLRRDTSLFDFVNALDFNHNHLYVGTDEAMYIYDGGRWATVTTENGLPSPEIRSIDASNWIVYVATTTGVVSYFNDEITPVNKLSNISPTIVKVSGWTILVSTDDGKLLKKAGPVVRTLIAPDNNNNVTINPVALTIQ